MLSGIQFGKKVLNENILNTLIPISTLKHLISSNQSVQCICFVNGKFEVKILEKDELTIFTHETIRTEQRNNDSRFINFPPDDIQIKERFFECKTVVRPCHAASKIIELIVRQNNIACCIQSIITKNPTITTINDELIETPYVVLSTYNTVGLTCMLITDLALLQMIIESSKNGRGKRSVIATTQINNWIQEFYVTGKIIYKKEKTDTVKHQKVTIFPIDYVPDFKLSLEKQPVIDYSKIVLGNVCEKRTLCGYIKERETEIKMEKLKKRISALENENDELRRFKRARVSSGHIDTPH